MNPLNFYTHPDKLNYEVDVDPIGRDLIKGINSSDYLRTTMYCSGHFEDEEEYPWMNAQMDLCLVALDDKKAYIKLEAVVDKLQKEFGLCEVHGGGLYLYLDAEDNNRPYHLAELLVHYETKEGRDKTIQILKETLLS